MPLDFTIGQQAISVRDALPHASAVCVQAPFFLILFNPLTIEPKTSFFLGFRTAEVPNGTFGSERSSKCGLTANQAISPLRGDLCVLRRQPFNRPFHRIENNIVALEGP